MKNWMGHLRVSPLVWTGLIGSVVAGLCCTTPILVAVLGMLGLAGLIGLLDNVLLPVLVACVGLTIYGLYRQ